MPTQTSDKPDVATPRDPSGLRVSDADRHEVVEALGRHAGDGCLTIEELEERSSHALAAKTRADLRGLLSDLPGIPGLHSPALSWAGAVYEGKHGRAAAQAAATHRHAPELKKRPRTLLGRIYRHCESVITVGAVLTGVWLLSGGGYYWPAWVLVPLAAVAIL